MKRFCILFSSFLFSSPVFCQMKTDSVLVEGHYRVFHFLPPAKKEKQSIPLFILHGSGGSGEVMMKPSAALQAIAGDEGFLLVYPDGYKHYWNECRKEAKSEANRENINEEAFFESMLRYFSGSYGSDANRFFAIGLSGGGHMCYKLALTMPGKCRGISVVVANMPDTNNLDCSEAKKAIAVLISNGTADDVNPYNGGPMIVNGGSYGEVRSTKRSFGYWAQLAGYNGSPEVRELADRDTANKQSLVSYRFAKKGRPEVTLIEVRGGGHAFPKDIDIFLESAAFFKREIVRENKKQK